VVFVVAGGQETGHQVTAVDSGLAVIFDEVADAGAPGGHGAVVAAVAGGREAARQGQNGPGVDAAQERIEGAPEEFGSGGVEVGGEQGAQRDRGGEDEHLVHQVHAVAVVPGRHGRGDLLTHHGDVAAHVLAAEGGLHDQPLAAVVGVGGTGQAVAHGRSDALIDQARSVESAKIGQHLAGQGRVAHDVGRLGPSLISTRSPWAGSESSSASGRRCSATT
jgi:hypothetical protein